MLRKPFRELWNMRIYPYGRVGLQALVLLTAVLLWCSFSFAAEFSADFSVKTKGEDEIVGKIFVKDKKIRQEVTEEGELQIMIIRPDKSLTWMLTPGEKVYIEIPYDSESQTIEPWSAEREKEAKSLGEESLNGHPTKKFETVDEGEKAVFWVSKKLSFPIKIEDSESVMEYKNIKEGSVPDSQFEIPAGYEKMAMPTVSPEKGSAQ
jgi:hypothetical protein